MNQAPFNHFEGADPAEPGFSAQHLLVAAREAVREALARHKSNGDSIVVWRDGQVVILKPEEIELLA